MVKNWSVIFLVVLFFTVGTLAEDDVGSAVVDGDAAEEDIDCSAKPEVGMCKALIPRYFYNPETDKCETFNYGGCGGNTNNFIEIEECENACVGKNIAPKTLATGNYFFHHFKII